MFQHVLCEVCGNEIDWGVITHSHDGTLCCSDCKLRDDMNHVFGIINNKASSLNFLFNNN